MIEETVILTEQGSRSGLTGAGLTEKSGVPYDENR
jgi:hypothetical protein